MGALAPRLPPAPPRRAREGPSRRRTSRARKTAPGSTKKPTGSRANPRGSACPCGATDASRCGWARARRPRRAARGAAATMEKADAHAGVAAELREPRLRFLQSPLAREDSGILVAVAVPDHDLLRERPLFAPPIPRDKIERAPRHRLFE